MKNPVDSYVYGETNSSGLQSGDKEISGQSGTYKYTYEENKEANKDSSVQINFQKSTNESQRSFQSQISGEVTDKPFK